MLLLRFYVWNIVIAGMSSVITFRVIKGKKYAQNVVFKTTLPTVYQCAELCLRFTVCKAIGYIKVRRACYIENRVVLPEKLENDPKSVYVYRQDIPTEFGSSCKQHTCTIYEICVPDGTTRYSCKPLFQCIDHRPYHQWLCDYGNVGGCDENNIGKRLYKNDKEFYKLTEQVWMWVNQHCERQCRNCIENI